MDKGMTKTLLSAIGGLAGYYLSKGAGRDKFVGFIIGSAIGSLAADLPKPKRAD